MRPTDTGTLDTTIAQMLRNCLCVPSEAPIPKPLIEKILGIYARIRGYRKKLDIRTVALVVDDWVEQHGDEWQAEQDAIEDGKRAVQKHMKNQPLVARAGGDTSLIDWRSIEIGSPVAYEYNGKEMAGKFMMAPGGAQEGLLRIRGEDQESQQFRLIPATEVRLLQRA